MQAILINHEILKDTDNRMHAFEAVLFMIGYNVSCLSK